MIQTFERGCGMKKNSCLLLCLIMLFGIISFSMTEDDYVDPYIPSYKTYDTTYDDILKMWIRVINGEDNGQHDLFNDNYYYDFAESGPTFAKDSIGYVIQDLNHDGSDELILTYIYPRYSNKASSIFSLFTTTKDGKVRELIRSGARSSTCLSKDGEILQYASESGHELFCYIYHFNGTNALNLYEGYFYTDEDYRLSPKDRFDAVVPGTHYYYSIGKNQYTVPDGQAPLDTEQIDQRLAAFDENQVTFYVTSLADYERKECGPQYTILSVNGKTKGSSTVNIRQKPDKKSKLVATKKVGTKVEILEEDGDYYLVSIGSKKGYVQKQYVSTVNETPGATTRGKAKTTQTPKATNTPKPTEKNDPVSTPTPTPVPTAVPTPEPEIDHYETYKKIVGYQTIIDGYEDQPVQRSREVLDHYETYYTYGDNGAGYFEETPHQRPVYRTEYYTEYISVPITHDEPIYETVTEPVYKKTN